VFGNRTLLVIRLVPVGVAIGILALGRSGVPDCPGQYIPPRRQGFTNCTGGRSPPLSETWASRQATWPETSKPFIWLRFAWDSRIRPHKPAYILGFAFHPAAKSASCRSAAGLKVPG
jgi:hypothetical protein